MPPPPPELTDDESLRVRDRLAAAGMLAPEYDVGVGGGTVGLTSR